ncbi:calcium-binding protein [Microvirga pudoricolor]|uniref:calcium-binding protein n=1 Tax=Microvirga pudoricolor TaxID=2778729 RepID=UPI0019503727|nr:calcium-binding protein [Microvirga pudoricolor]MBM6592411.1 hypothetical protein [Microvirga pudoricolor]
MSRAPAFVRSNLPDETLLRGTGARDRLTGGPGADVLLGLGGDDRLEGGRGSDVLLGGDGDDLLSGGPGGDHLVGGAGRDVFRDSLGANVMAGGGGDDLFLGAGASAHQDVLTGDAGRDTFALGAALDPGSVADVVTDFAAGPGGDLNDLAGLLPALRMEPLAGVNPFATGHLSLETLGDGTALVASASGGLFPEDARVVLVLQGIDRASLTADNFTPAYPPLRATPNGTAQDDILAGMDGGHPIWGYGGNDTIWAGAGDDHLMGGPGRDVLLGHGGADTIEGGVGSDWIDAGAGNDLIFGNEHDDTILGGAGDDVIHADPDWRDGNRYRPAPPGGSDFIDAGDGNDVIYDWRAGNYDHGNTILGGAGDDLFYYTSGRPDILAYEFYPIEGVDRLTGGAGRDTFRLENIFDSVGDVVTDFEAGPGGDIIDYTPLLNDLGGGDPFRNGYLSFEQAGTSTLITGLHPWLGIPTVFLTLENTRIEDLTRDNFVPPFDPQADGILPHPLWTAGTGAEPTEGVPEHPDWSPADLLGNASRHGLPDFSPDDVDPYG